MTIRIVVDEEPKSLFGFESETIADGMWIRVPSGRLWVLGIEFARSIEDETVTNEALSRLRIADATSGECIEIPPGCCSTNLRGRASVA